MNKILLKTTVEDTHNDWCVHRFQLLKDTLALAGFSVESRNRKNDAFGNDPDLQSLPGSDYDQLWLFGIEERNGGLTKTDADHIDAFRRTGKGCMLARDHMDVGNTLVQIPVIGPANHYHTVNPEADMNRRKRDDTYSMHLDWPNYHSGLNGSIQPLEIMRVDHPLFMKKDRLIRFFPAHPHEGAISVPRGTESFASIIAKGRSRLSDREFNLIVAFDNHPAADSSEQVYGRAVVHSSFHHFADYNWDPGKGCPDFVTDPEGDEMMASLEAQQDIRCYSINLAHWLSGGLQTLIKGEPYEL